MIKQVLVVKWGTKYGPEYVNRMYGMVSRNITGPFRFVCLTDDATGLRKEVIAEPLPELGCAWPTGTFGQWRKVVLLGANVPGLSPGPALFVDLDSVIVGSIDEYFEIGEPDDVFLARNWTKPHRRLGQTSVFRFPVGKYPFILERFRSDPQGVADRCRYEQHYITESIPGGVKFWPRAWTRHFRLHCLPIFPLRYFVPARLPKSARIITFPGHPNPGEAMEGRWLRNQTAAPSRLRHLLDTFYASRRLEPRPLRHVTRYLLPVPWLKRYWVE
jgi:hypothetical protein